MVDQILIPNYHGYRSHHNPTCLNPDGSPMLTVNCRDAAAASDGFHTFGELYRHRNLLYLAWLKDRASRYDTESWRSRLHHDGGGYPGWFIVGEVVCGKQITYHLPDDLWELASFLPEHPRAPVPWDGHSPSDVLTRLEQYLRA